MLKEAMLYEKQGKNFTRCFLCAHRCTIQPGKFGLCGVRENKDGTLYTHTYGDVIAQHNDPIEKKPLYHFMPGTRTYSIAAAGCNFRCTFCQNWEISQLNYRERNTYGKHMAPESIVEAAVKEQCQSIAYTYTEPTIFFEYAFDIAKLAKARGIANVFVTNGFMTSQALQVIRPYLDACNVDLKSFSDDFYQRLCSARLQPVLDTIMLVKELGVWVEITTLLIPDQNDSAEEVSRIAEFIASTGKDIPWHISRFFPRFAMKDAEPASVDVLYRAQEIGLKKGLKNVHLGNV
ncbi:MAG: AmmeMemoRadiSam system radical SAM enzyme [Candidatus Raymondbacteria bacterium RifOxyA12_full_50_37]|uniref:AmmeMemoRadiSam system radical SAM enzyme n=1 Tax=Candidatus Raymondbacteria bacterium RIFOXYD12_FULL_49_13 TaxID=1817890 RepID=A0A1F7EZE6_UNCRA|nr:MAG: AmmeMemoRadiSam system radical SAM enzyme [Candidatus Raymondbacteria bacterium RifOxyB12_full_50_8]OGJ92185.1 MAG: AmmeMemoRadiSam system radical SAM enzyme [Candidatus Raymondbacteria bacterium RifOxyA12_full_50_37]OGJ94232.1 MAG: AmmeMemoRadiSam system radical SAM enzyme [Candidatus Raymondbacteria bacterium RifOxyC12_full_50_8]OGJ94468.1 MAG: AmmeMemoRadiSam system radical SAM enzyme [Candidatus Raymondbacteria bacterium RIFOXYA2_FULL_49_16]OGJ99224.1 MAG: AmmeMemoRadiSam system rad